MAPFHAIGAAYDMIGMPKTRRVHAWCGQDQLEWWLVKLGNRHKWPPANTTRQEDIETEERRDQE